MNRFLLFFCFISISLVFSQNFDAGILAGINTSQVSGDNLSGFNKLGVKIGGFVSREFNTFNAQLELQYINKGSRNMTDDDTHQEQYKFQLNYIQIPCLIKTSIYKNTFVEFGASIAYLLNWTEKYYGYEDRGIDVNKLEYNIHVGVDYKINRYLHLNTRLSNSIVPIRPHASGKTHKWNKGQYNTCLSFVLCYYFNKKLKNSALRTRE